MDTVKVSMGDLTPSKELTRPRSGERDRFLSQRQDEKDDDGDEEDLPEVMITPSSRAGRYHGNDCIAGYTIITVLFFMIRHSRPIIMKMIRAG